jgi:hypothetical protein
MSAVRVTCEVSSVAHPVTLTCEAPRLADMMGDDCDCDIFGVCAQCRARYTDTPTAADSLRLGVWEDGDTGQIVGNDGAPFEGWSTPGVAL